MEYNKSVQDQTCIIGYVTSVLGRPALNKQISLGWVDQPTCLLSAKNQKSLSHFLVGLIIIMKVTYPFSSHKYL